MSNASFQVPVAKNEPICPYAPGTAQRSSLKGALDQMASGGIRDHLAGGFHRYATDRRWLVPHFEKMLYDNAQLARLYVEAWQWSLTLG